MTDKNSLEKLKAEYEQKIAEMELRYKQEIALLKEENAAMRRRLFSSKSERTKIILPNPDQLSLFNEVEQEASPELSEEATTVKAHKRTKQRTQRKLDLSKAEHNVVILDIPERTVIALHVEVLSWFPLGKSIFAMRYVLSPQRLLLMKYTRLSTSATPVKMMNMWNL